MHFRSDEQRKAVMAKFSGINRFARRSQMELMSDELAAQLQTPVQRAESISTSDLKLPEGTQSVYLVDTYGGVQSAKDIARNESKVIADSLKASGHPEAAADVMPIWDNEAGTRVGYAVVAWDSKRGVGRRYIESPPGMEPSAFLAEGMAEERATRPSEVKEPIIKDPYREMEAQLLSGGHSQDFAKAISSEAREYDVHKAYLDGLLREFDLSGEEDFDRFKEKYNKKHGYKKEWGPGVALQKEAPYRARFSKKADYNGVYENINGDFTCSYCGNSFSSRHTAASHAAKCDDNAFNDQETEYDEDNDEECGSTFDIN